AGFDTARDIAVGIFHTCAVGSDNRPVCWGLNDEGQTSIPPGVDTVRSIDVGTYSTCAIGTSGEPVCWGDPWSGVAPVPAGVGSVTDLSVGDDFACAVRTDGSPVCWGANDRGQIEIPSGLAKVQPSPDGDWHTCSVRPDGTPLCWGFTREDGIELALQVSGALTVATSEPIGADFAATMSTAGFTLTGGRLPDGIMLTADGRLSGSSNTPGEYPVTVRAENGYVSAKRSTTITVFDTTITSGSTDQSAGTISFTASSAADSFACTLDGSEPAPCSSPYSYTDLADGDHTFTVAATVNGQVDPTPATVTWTVGDASTPTSSAPAPTTPPTMHVAQPTDGTAHPGRGSSRHTTLPATGSHLATPIAAALVSLVAGAALVYATRRRKLT
ncbi:MAG TPA: LPXTG cell wall anchor domain-containing protein, partial [Acidimicrobiales bacterium]|nr:LPXTG cell wall anchor domain-containing protein [Acidimicrobiales bacterium]